ncbi:DUF3558 domain-containing protein [Nocardia panacis]|uniref:DUF3558 domain-containing protein n=1 Tax=Nocardia panacis TaxID=2340916 RepID=A0A3A4K2M2_9NOCA|nr:DUF3558 domain-containing protein [Nocardia panacis]RJO68236.1 DUF3558 domain-containing protein [Nocardia panacis]
MTAARVARTGFALALASAALLTACGDSAKAVPTSSASPSPIPPSSSAPQVFDACKALTPQLLAEHRWDARPPAPQNDRVAETTWRGCLFIAKAGYGFVVQTTNGTLALVRTKFPDAAEVVLGGRKALRYKAHPAIPGGCEVNVEMKSGSLFVSTNVPPSATDLATCDLAIDIAETVTPLLPAGA